LTSLDLRTARGEIDRPHWHDPGIAVLQERGFRHEVAYLSYLKDRGHTVLADEDGLDEEGRLLDAAVRHLGVDTLERGRGRGSS
jgi:hypothetical protein